jgi:DNA polymerase
MNKTYHLDYETRSHCDLPKCGGWRYAFDPTTEILCIGVAEEEGEPVVWTPWNRDKRAERMMRDFANPETVIYAHNATGFEVPVTDALFTKTTGLTAPQHHQWRCTAAMGRRAALPASLKRLAEALKLTNQKDDKGAGLIRKFSIPNAKTNTWVEPEEEWEAFQQFCDYCRQDVKVEQEIHQKLKAFELKGFPLQVFQLDLEINARGFPVNLDALRYAKEMVSQEAERLAAEFRALTGLNPTQGEKFKAWLREHDCNLPNLQATTLEDLFESETFDPSTEWGKALDIKKRTGFASLGKIDSMIECAGPHDNKVRGTLVEHGARTGRWSAVLVQPQNFKRPVVGNTEGIYDELLNKGDRNSIDLLYGEPMACISSSIRHFIQDVENGEMLDADFAAIEARILAWQAKEEWKLEVFRTHGKIYEATACQMFGLTMKDFEDYAKEHKGAKHPARQKAKAGELGCGYAGGVGALITMGALRDGLKESELPAIIKLWRERNPAIVAYWGTVENAARRAIKTPNTKFPFGIGCSFFSTVCAGRKYLFMVLPSGRKVAYPDPEFIPQITWKEPDKEVVENGEKKVEFGMRKVIFKPTPEQMAQVRRKFPEARLSDAIGFFGKLPDKKKRAAFNKDSKDKWGTVVTYSGKLVENCIQGIAADFMAHGAIKASRAGYEICALIHDEALAYYHPKKGQSLEEFVSLLTELPPWAEGMPLKAEGDVVKFYKK